MNFTHVGGHGIYFGAGPPPFARDDDDDDDDDARGRGFERVMSRIQLGAMNDGGARYVGQERRVDRPPKTETKLNRLVELGKWKELREDLVEKGVEMERWCGQPGRIVSAGAGIVFDAKVARARWVKNQKDAAKEAAKKALPGKPIAKAKEKKKQRAAEWDVDAVDLYDAILHPTAPADVLRGLIVLASDDVLKTRMKAANKKKRCMLHAAAQMRAPEVLSALLERVPKGDVTYRDVEGNTPLMLMLGVNTKYGGYGAGASATVLHCLDRLAKADESCVTKLRARDKATTLHASVESRQCPRVVAELVKRHPDACKARDKDGYLPLHHALYAQADKETFKALLDAYPAAAGCKDGDGVYPLHMAVEDGAPAEVAEMLMKADRESITRKDERGHLPLHVALVYGQTNDMVRTLLRANPAACAVPAERGSFPLHLVLNPHFPVTVVKEILKEHPKAVFEANNEGLTPLHLACTRGSVECVELILKANPAAAAMYARNRGLPLHVAASAGALGRLDPKSASEICQALVHAFPDGATRVDEEGRLPIHLAAESETGKEVIETLYIAFPGGIHHVDAGGRSPADRVPRADKIRLLIEGMDPQDVKREREKREAAARRAKKPMYAAAATGAGAAAKKRKGKGGKDGDDASGKEAAERYLSGADALSLVARVCQGASSDLVSDDLASLKRSLLRYADVVDDELRRRPIEEAIIARRPEWMCPIGHSIMRDPVLASDGHHYERKKIETWMRRSRRETIRSDDSDFEGENSDDDDVASDDSYSDASDTPSDSNDSFRNPYVNRRGRGGGGGGNRGRGGGGGNGGGKKKAASRARWKSPMTNVDVKSFEIFPAEAMRAEIERAVAAEMVKGEGEGEGEGEGVDVEASRAALRGKAVANTNKNKKRRTK